MAVDYDTGYNKKRFGHCVINWKIENYCLASCREGWNINSPEFYVRGPQTTKWKMILNPKSKVKNTFCVTLYLERLESDPGPDIVWANWSLNLLDKQNEVYCSTECDYYFDNKSNYGVDLLNTKNILEKLCPFDQDTLHIRCRLIVNHETPSCKKFEKSSDIGLRSLSQDLKALYKCSLYLDISIKTEGKEIRAHKAVLYARNRTIARLVDEAKDKESITLEQDSDAVKKVIGYLYSGNLEFVLLKPSISLYTCIMYLKIEEVMSYYVPDELILHTAVDVQEFAFLWMIADFSNIKEDCIMSPIFNKGISETCWRLRLYPGGVGDDVKHIGIQAEIVEGKKNMDVCIEFAVMNDNQEFYFSRRLCKSIEGNETFGCNDFIKQELLENSSLLANSTLRVVFKLRILKGEKVSSVGCRMMSFISKKENNYLSLSIDMLGMYEHVPFRDIVLFAEGKPLRAHKCILAARSSVFASMIDKMREDQTSLTVKDIIPKVLQILLNYIYCGVLKGFEVRGLVQVYEAADSFAVFPLKEECSRILQSNIDLESVCSILILADNKMDKKLKLSALMFICLNAPEVFKLKYWETFAIEKPFMSTEVLKYVESNREKLKSSTETQETNQNILEQPQDASTFQHLIT